MLCIVLGVWGRPVRKKKKKPQSLPYWNLQIGDSRANQIIPRVWIFSQAALKDQVHGMISVSNGGNWPFGDLFPEEAMVMLTPHQQGPLQMKKQGFAGRSSFPMITRTAERQSRSPIPGSVCPFLLTLQAPPTVRLRPDSHFHSGSAQLPSLSPLPICPGGQL